MKHISEILKMQRITILYDNDLTILDWLADLKDRRLIKYMDEAFNDMVSRNVENYVIIMKSRLDNLFVLVIYNAPFGFCKGDNKLMLYAHNSIAELCKYFKRWMESEQNKDKAVQIGLHEITQLLYFNYAQETDSNIQVNFLG
jgi:hypothetical protein